MPSYANYDDLVRFFSSANISDWADKDRDGALNDQELSAVNAALDASQALVDSYLHQAGYAAPFDPSALAELPAPLRQLIRRWTVVITGFHLYAWRGIQDKTNPLEALYRHTLSQLQAVVQGLPLAGLARDATVRFGTGADPHQPTDHLNHLRDDGWNW